MADIILAGDSFSLKKLRSAAEQLEDAQNLMQKVYDAVFGTGFWAETDSFALLSGKTNMNVFDGTIDELNAFQQRVHQKEETLRTLAQRIEAAVQEIAETDQSFRGKLSGESRKTTWERITGAVRSVGQTASAAAVALVGAINGLFSSDGTVAGEVVVDPHEKIKPMTQDEIAKQNLYAKYEDDKYIDKTELKMAIETSKDAEEAEQRIQSFRSSKYEYRTSNINSIVPIGEVQHYQTNGKTTEYVVDKNTSVGQCTWVSTTTLINRKRADEGKSTTATCDDLLAQGGHFSVDRTFKYDGSEYTLTKFEEAYSDTGLVQLLKKHPEGVVIYDNGHAIVITDYSIIDGHVQFYADDGVNNLYYENKGRIPLEETWFYKKNGGRLENLDWICYIQ